MSPIVYLFLLKSLVMIVVWPLSFFFFLVKSLAIIANAFFCGSIRNPSFGDVYVYFLKVCDLNHSELIPCLDRNLIYQLKLKPNLTLMEHYERHCPPPHRRYNCLIPPPIGYKVGNASIRFVLSFLR